MTARFSYDYLNDNWFDISVSPADFIFFNRPYDSELVHNNYKSKKLIKYSKICFLH